MTKNAAQPPGRPSTYTDAIAATICERLAKGEPMAVICRDDNMPSVGTVRNWREASKPFSDSIARAREDGFDTLAAECLEISEDGSQDYSTKERADGSKYDAFDAEHVQRSKLRIETRLKLLAKWDPKRYGERQTVEHTDPDGKNPWAALMEQVGLNGRPRPGS